jgi:hypothetical protein
MSIRDQYFASGYAHIQDLLSPAITRSLMHRIKQDTGDDALPLSSAKEFPNLLTRPAFEVYSHFYPPIQALLWGLTPKMADLTGLDLIPTYCYFRIYRAGDICRVHSDRQSCEHSLSLTLDYSDGEVWPLDVGLTRLPAPDASVDPDFGDAPFSPVAMQIGDAVLYQGTHHRHGRILPNPNGWSAHLFLHWVDRNGPYAAFAFDGQPVPEAVNFSFR